MYIFGNFLTSLLPCWFQVGGAVREVTGYTATYRHTISVDEGGDEGDCLHVRLGYHHVIKGFPHCVVADAVINFFMARTDKVQQVGFDPRFSRQGHLGELLITVHTEPQWDCSVHNGEKSNVANSSHNQTRLRIIHLFFSFNSPEFFISALGYLHIGSCSDVIVSHASKIKLPWTKTKTQKAYEKFRYLTSNVNDNIFNEVLYFKNRFKCMTSQWNMKNNCSQVS